MTDQIHGVDYGAYKWWVGSVEDRDDPLKIGRVRVRINGYHPDDKGLVPTEALPWAITINPITDAGQKGVGMAPVGLQVGSQVTGFFLDGENAQMPAVTGVLVGAPNGRPDTNRLTRGEEISQTIVEAKNKNRLISLPLSLSSSLSSIANIQQNIQAQVSGVTNQMARIKKMGDQLKNAKLAIPGIQIPDISAAIQGVNGQFQGLRGNLQSLNSAANGVKTASDNVVNVITDNITQVYQEAQNINNAASQLGGVQNDIRSQILRLQGGMAEVTSQVDNQVEALTDIPKSAMAGIDNAVGAADRAVGSVMNGLNGITGNITGTLDQLKSLDKLRSLNPGIGIPDVSNLIGSFNQLTNAFDAIGNLSGAMNSLNQIVGVIGKIKGLSMVIPNAASILGAITALQAGPLSNMFMQPLSPANPEYPFNKVFETEGGHVEEFDDTPGSERYQRYHPSGTFVEDHPDGTRSEKVVKDRYTVIMGDDSIHVQGNVKVNIIGNADVVVVGNATTQVNGNKTDIVKGDYSLMVGGNMSTAVGLMRTDGAGVMHKVTAPQIWLN